MANAAQEASQARVARIAGAMYVLTMATAIFSEFVVKSSLVVPGDATHTAQNIIASERLYRIGIASDLVTATGVVVLIWALYVLLRPVDRNLALLAAFWRLGEAAILYALTLNSLVVLALLSGADYLKWPKSMTSRVGKPRRTFDREPTPKTASARPASRRLS